MKQLMQQSENLNLAVEQLLNQALQRGASDNLTVILYRHESIHH